jgi:rhodanese-related sulfurtransferase
MVKKVIKKRSRKNINLGLVLLILIVITGFLYFTHSNVPEKKPFSNYSGSVMMPAADYIYNDVSVLDAKKLADKNFNNPDFLIVDVSLNYNEGHIVNAVSYPIADGSLGTAINALDKDKIYLVYGRNEIDSLNAAKKLAAGGFSNVYRLKGNYGTWVDIGYPINNSY